MLGTFGVPVVGMVAAIPLILLDAHVAAKLLYQFVFWGYEIAASVGVWRSANALIEFKAGRLVVTYVDSAKIFGAKIFVIFWACENIVRIFGKPLRHISDYLLSLA